ncbi:hypothetical protein [Arthrobacter sp. LAR12-1-1.1]|uniref:hypothetical protein n=1 Tax=Arthrobacter sp. LAR12-1-1.1 TaxID=3135215 RepID=UPI0034283CF4
MSVSTVPNNAVEVTPEAANSLAVDSPKRLTIEQAQALYGLIKTFRPDWDRPTVMRQMQTTALYSELAAADVVRLFIDAAAGDAGKPFEAFDFPGHNRWPVTPEAN